MSAGNPDKFFAFPIENILFHEKDSHARVEKLAPAIEAEGEFWDPVVVAMLSPENLQAVQLDGATRAKALRGLGAKHIVGHVVSMNDGETDGFNLSSWAHKTKISPDRIRELAAGQPDTTTIKEINISESPADGLDCVDPAGALATIVYANGGLIQLCSSAALPDRIKLLHRLYELYEGPEERLIVGDRKPGVLLNHARIQNGGDAVVMFPEFNLHNIKEVVTAGEQFPPGITRFILKERFLRLDLPLDILFENTPTEVAQKKLDEYLESVRWHGYTDGTVYLAERYNKSSVKDLILMLKFRLRMSGRWLKRFG